MLKNFLLGVGCFFLPPIFCWFTLQRKYPKWAKVLAFGWFALFVGVNILSDGPEEASNTRPQQAQKAEPAPNPESAPKPQPTPARKAKAPKPRGLKAVSIGEPVQFQGWKAQFAEPFTSDHNGDDKPARGNVYLTVPYEITNQSERSRKDPMEKLEIHSGGKKHLNRKQRGESTYTATLRPNQSQSQWQTFEVPAELTDKPFIVEFPNGGKPEFVVELKPGDVRTDL